MRVKKVCYNCGRVTMFNNKKCPACNTTFTKIRMLDGIKLSNMNGEETIGWIENKLGYPLPNKELHKKYIEQCKCQKEQERINKQFEDYSTALEHGRQILEEQKNVPKCPICGSANINKITVGSRAVKTAVFGVYGAVDDAGKTYKCGKCGCKF